MSILGSALGALKSITDYLGITDKNMPATPNAHKTTVPLSNPSKVAPNEDTIKIGEDYTSQTTKPATKQKRDYYEYERAVYTKMLKAGLESQAGEYLRDIVGVHSQAEFDGLSMDDKYIAMEALDAVLDSYIDAQKANNVGEGKDIKSLIVSDAKVVKQAVETGHYKSANAFVDKIDRKDAPNKILKHNGKSATDIEIQNNANRFRKQSNEEFAVYKANFEQNLRKRGVSEEKIQEEINKLESLRSLEDKATFDRVFMAAKNHNLKDFVQILGNEIAHGIEVGLSSIINDEERQAIADQMDVTYLTSLIDICHKNGDKLEAKCMQDSTMAATQYMSHEGVINNEKTLYDMRTGKLSENLPKCLNKSEIQEMFTAMTTGIGAGAVINSVLTNEQKESLLSVWNGHAKQFSDYERVINNVNTALKTYINTHPTAANIEEIKLYQKKFESISYELQQEKIANKSKAEKEEKSNDTNKELVKKSKTILKNNGIVKDKTTENEQETTNKKERLSVVTNPNKLNTNKANGELTSKPNTNVTTKPTAVYKDSEIIEIANNSGIEKAISKCGLTSTIEAIICDEHSKHLRPRMAYFIKYLDYNTANEIAQNCSDPAFKFLYDNVNEQIKYELFNNNKNKIGYDIRTIIETQQEHDKEIKQNYEYQLA